MKYVSLFAGIGGFDLALNRLGHECVYVNEWDKYAAQTYEKNFGHKPDTRDITTVPEDSIPDHEILVGGFPCQAFSVAGKRRGFAETRGTLFFDIARILKAKQPRWFILENVKGLLSHDTGRTFKTIVSTLAELGYDLQWQVLNSKNFGVPQNRERVFIIGHLRGEPRPKVFPIQASSEPIIQKEYELPVSGTLSTKNQSGQANWDGSTTLILQHSRKGKETKYNYRKTADTLHQPSGNTTNFVQRVPLKFLTRNQKNIEGDYAFTVDGANTGGVKVSKTIRVGGAKSPFGSKQNWDSYEVEGRIRRLTPIECERLQGFPDNWTQGISDTQRYKCLGNAVTVNVIQSIMQRL